jgi:hypothetical protein
MALFDGLKGIIFTADDCQATKYKRGESCEEWKDRLIFGLEKLGRGGKRNWGD